MNCAGGLIKTQKYSGASINVPKELGKLNETTRSEVQKRFEKLGLHNVLDYRKVLHKNQKTEALGYAITAAGATIGALLTVADNMRWLKGEFKKRENDSHQAAAQR